MNLTTDLEIQGNFTRIPNEVLDDDSLTDSEFRLWCRMLRQIKGKAPVNLGDSKTSNKILGVATSTSRNLRNKLTKKGYLHTDGGLVYVSIPADDFVAAEDLLIDEVVEEPNRKPSGVTEKDAMIAISEAWNNNKPESFISCTKRLRPEAFWAIETQAKRLKIERPQYGKFVKQVMKGACQDEWLSKQTWKIHNMFGWFDPKVRAIDDKKVVRVEELYKKGQVLPDVFNWTDPEIFAWYAEAVPDREFDRIEWMEADLPEASLHNKEHKHGKVIYIYTYPGEPKRWTLFDTRELRYAPNT
jgi:hypothetical protein